LAQEEERRLDFNARQFSLTRSCVVPVLGLNSVKSWYAHTHPMLEWAAFQMIVEITAHHLWTCRSYRSSTRLASDLAARPGTGLRGTAGPRRVEVGELEERLSEWHGRCALCVIRVRRRFTMGGDCVRRWKPGRSKHGVKS
jgi:hypothetical protein